MYMIKQLIKNVIAYSLYYSGILFLYKFLLFRDRIIVLMYHRVLSDDEKRATFSNNSIIVSTNNFTKQIDFLNKYFSIISPAKLTHANNTRDILIKNKCFITFDDGWEDNYRNAFPVLNRNNVSATIFLPLDFIGTNNIFWQEKLSSLMYILLKKGNPDNHLLQEYFPELKISNNISHEEIIRIISNTIRNIKTFPNEEIDNIVNKYEQCVKDGTLDYEHPQVDKYLSWELIKIMNSSGINFGSHACSHRLLTKLTDKQAESEIKKSKEVLERILGDNVNAIAYPNGNYNEQIKSFTQKCGYTHGFTTERGHYLPGDDPYQVKRININDSSAPNIPRFFCRIIGIF